MTHTPKRIRRMRTRGWRMPTGAISVTRPGKFGNPFRVLGENEYLFCDASHRRTILCPWVIFNQDQDIHDDKATPQMAVDYFRRWLTGEFNAAGIVRPCLITPEQIESLRGHDLACWCKLCEKHKDGLPLGVKCKDCAPCHADMLLTMANSTNK